MNITAADDRLLGEWRLLGTSAGHLDTRPRIDDAVLVLSREPEARLRFDLHLLTPRRELRRSGLVPVKCPGRSLFALQSFMLWVLAAPFRVRLLMGPSGDVLCAVTPASMLTNPGILLLAREGVDAPTAYVTVLRELRDLELSLFDVRAMRWRMKVPGSTTFASARDCGTTRWMRIPSPRQE